MAAPQIQLGSSKGNRTRQNPVRSFLNTLGPGIVTGAADDDPSGIATYSQAGAQFGLGMLWMVLFMFPLMTAVQEMCARIGLVTGDGLGKVISNRYSRKVMFPLAGLLLIANTVNIGADIGAMSASAKLLLPQAPMALVTIGFTAFILAAEILLPYRAYVRVLKYLSLALFAYLISAIIVGGSWSELLESTLVPTFQLSPEFAVMFVAVLGTTISPYLFFWQASEEAEEKVTEGVIREVSGTDRPRLKRKEMRKMKADVVMGMAFSQAITWFVIVTAANTLHAHGETNITTAEQAASALEPLVKTFPHAGELAKTIFAAGIIGTGLLSVPVLAGASAYCLSDGFGWKQGLHKKFGQAKAFYAVIGASTLIGLWINFSGIDVIKALVYAAVINGIMAVPILVAVMRIANDRTVLGRLSNGLGWLTVAVMGGANVVLFVFWKQAFG